MALIGESEGKISFECEELIEELKSDILEFGEKLTVEVVTSKYDGIKLYKDYNFIENDKKTEFKLDPDEKKEIIKAVDLLEIYKKQNSIL